MFHFMHAIWRLVDTKLCLGIIGVIGVISLTCTHKLNLNRSTDKNSKAVTNFFRGGLRVR